MSNETGEDGTVLGPRLAPVKTTQFLGNAVGLSVVGDVLYAESDAGYVYSLDATRLIDNIILGERGDFHD